jgi:membrane-bound metal-dependent hydrolase YbcI (DUF457 family)
MFVGHFALGFAAKRAAPFVPLWLLFAAAQLADLLWPLFVALGVEQVSIEAGITKMTPLDFVSYPYSHSLLMLIVWGAVLGFVYQRSTKKRGAFVLLAGLVVSHWVLDFVTHRPDLPFYPGSTKVGLGLWNSTTATVSVELVLFAAGVWMYARATRARDAVGRWSFIALVGFLVIAYAGNIMGGAPPSVGAIWIAGLAGGAVLLLWSWLIDRHRESIW